MKCVEVRGVKIGEGIPKIIVPIVGTTEKEILDAAVSLRGAVMDLTEWRADYFDGVFDFAKVERVLKELRKELGSIPILFTFRTSGEGGEKEITVDAYAQLCIKAAQTGLQEDAQLDLRTVQLPLQRTVAFHQTMRLRHRRPAFQMKRQAIQDL